MILRSRLAYGVAGLTLFAASGCAVGGAPQLRSTGVPVAGNSVIALVAPEEPSEQEMAIGRAFSAAFGRNGIELSESAPLRAEFSLSLRPSTVELAREDDSGNVEWISRAGQTYILDACEREKSRIVLVLRDLEQNSIVYRSEGEIEGCDFTSDAANLLVGEMVEDAVSG